MLNPMPTLMVDPPSEGNRRVLCARYSECLEICLSKRWPGFSCAECQDFELERPNDPAYWAEQGKKSGWLLMNAGYLPKWIVNKARNQNGREDFLRDFNA